MKRRTFISISSTVTVGTLVPYDFIYRGKEEAYWGRVLGLLIPVLLDDTINSLFNQFDKSSSASETVIQAIMIIINNHNDKCKYKNYYNNNISPYLGKKRLNGQGYKQGVVSIRDKMNEKGYATTPVHSIRDVKNFDRDAWGYYYNNANLQTDDKGGVIVHPTDNRPSEYKGAFYVNDSHSYLIYNPAYHFIGLPIEDPQYHDVTEKFGREVKAKTDIKPTVDFFYTQRFYYQGDNDCQNLEGNTRTIYWEHDDAIRKFYGLTPLESCGDPSDDCGDGANKIVHRSRRS